MIHLFKHSKDGKFDIALVVKGKFILGSNQHYEKKSVARNLCKHFDKLLLQDDTVSPSKVYSISIGLKLIFTEQPNLKPSKPYIPNKKYTPKTKK